MREYLKEIGKFYFRNLELLFWIAAIFILAANDPRRYDNTLCLYTWITGNSCWGCGIGRSISWIFRGEFSKSFDTHAFGFLAIIAIVIRIAMIFKNTIKYHKNKKQ
ncbi:MAG: DUF2752 domain-containing protein [Bacteroidales bacterium]